MDQNTDTLPCVHAPVPALLTEIERYRLSCAAGALGFAPDGCAGAVEEYALLVDANWDGHGTRGLVVAPACGAHAAKVGYTLAPRALAGTMVERIPSSKLEEVLSSFHAPGGACTELGMHFLGGARDL